MVDSRCAGWHAAPVQPGEPVVRELISRTVSDRSGELISIIGPSGDLGPFPYGPPRTRTSDLDAIDWPICSVPDCIGVQVLRPGNTCLAHVDPDLVDNALAGGHVDLRGVEVSAQVAEKVHNRLRDRPARLSMQRAKVSGRLVLDGVEITGPCSFELAVFEDELSCRGTVFTQDVTFAEAEFRAGVTMSGATFRQGLDFTRCRSYGDVDLSESVLEKPAALGDLFLSDNHVLVLDRMSALGQLDLSVHVIVFGEVERASLVRTGVSCYRSEFADGLHLALTRASVSLERTTFGGPSVVWSPANLVDDSRLLSLWGTDCSNLTISNLLLTSCRFAGGVNLDKLRIDGPVLLPWTPRGWRMRAASLPPVWRWTKRLCLYDEYVWRANHLNWPGFTFYLARQAGWNHSPEPVPPGLASHRPDRDETSAAHLASVYRALRKGREDAKDEPGAGDFYYGEMEMRRKALGTYWSERLLLHIYWLVSAYGQRATRAFTLLLVVLLGGAWWMSVAGFAAPRSYGDSLLYAVQAVIGVSSAVPLSTTGEVVRILLKVLVPVLAGLGLLAVRGRVKR